MILSLLLTLFNEHSLATFVNLGSYVGAGALLLGCWQLTSSSSDVVQNLHMQQRVDNFHAELAGEPHPHKDMIQTYLSSGTLAFGGLFWLVLLQTVRYGLNVSLG